jgi:predicted Zn-dependent protease
MTPPSDRPLAFDVAEHVRSEGPWEVFAERLRRYEVHFNGRKVEVIRGPLLIEGYGLRVFRNRGDVTGSGFQSSTDTSPASIAESLREAERIAAHSTFPTKHVDLPARRAGGKGGPGVLDRALWDAPLPRLEEYLAALLAPFDSLPDVVPSFGSVRATMAETSVTNSSRLEVRYYHTTVDLEIALKAFGGAEGAPPGEYWVNDRLRRLDPTHAGDPVARWAQYARDARRAKTPPSGDLPVVLPAEVTVGILPLVLGFRFSGAARLRKIAPEKGAKLAAPSVSLWDDGTIPWAPSSAPVDDEGTPMGRRALIQNGEASELMYDLLHAGAFDQAPTGNGLRGLSFGIREWRRFETDVGTGPTTTEISPGEGGTDEELIEAAGDGVWVQQLGWPSPDPASGAFGGEVRIGYRIRNGKLAEPVRGGTVGGVVLAGPGEPSLLASVAALGSKSSLVDSLRGPTLLVKPLTVAGA